MAIPALRSKEEFSEKTSSIDEPAYENLLVDISSRRAEFKEQHHINADAELRVSKIWHYVSLQAMRPIRG